MAARNGFRPARDPDTRYVQNFLASAGGQPIAKGDAVIRNTAGKITAMPAGMDPGAGFGVVLAVYTSSNGNLNRPFTHQATKFIASATTGRADVCWDPSMTYFVRCETSIGVGDIHSRVMVSAAAATAATGIGGMSVAVETSASVANPFKIIDLSPFEQLGGKNTGQAAGQEVEVAWNNHYLRTGA
jgi:hypothetical protein